MVSFMQKRKLPRDANALAAQVVAMSTGQPVPGQQGKNPRKAGKNPAAVELGRLGGLKGGKARADKLSRQKRAEIARLAAAARWKKS